MRSLMTGSAIAALLCGASAQAANMGDAEGLAARFGHRENVIDVSLSPDGQYVAYIVPGKGKSTIAVVSRWDGTEPRAIVHAEGNPLNIQDCGWSAADRIVCKEYGISLIGDVRAPFTRVVALDRDGSHIQFLGHRTTHDETRVSQFDGSVIDWLAGDDGTVLMTHDFVPEDRSAIGNVGDRLDGMGVQRVDTRTGVGRSVELPQRGADTFISDGRGTVRMMAADENHGERGMLTGVRIYYYRLAHDRSWKPFSRVSADGDGLRPIAVDGQADVAYALKSLDGRDALYKVALDGSMKTELAYANPIVDVGGVVTIGRGGRVIGAAYTTDRRQIEYFDPQYRKLALALSKALPALPLIYFISASADEKRLLVFAGSDVDPGHYYILDRTTLHLDELAPARAPLEGLSLSPVKSVTYPAGDGTRVPAYLTLPPGGDGKHLPAILLPHGGPASRDEWGFDWLAQYFAQRGCAVLQPEFRGSAGYGDAWYVQNGFKSWKTAISDITDGALWLQKQGIADPDRLAIMGWSYGGYAALQANVVTPALFKAVVAIAPVTDLGMLKSEAQNYTNGRLVSKFVGDGPHIAEGSPARHADRFQAPVLIFHGDQDVNVDIRESRAMDKALDQNGKKHELVTFKGLDHQLDDSDARASMLAKADAFLRSNLGMSTP